MKKVAAQTTCFPLCMNQTTCETVAGKMSKIKNTDKKQPRFYAAITKTHLTEPQVLQGGKVSVLDNGIRAFSPLLLQKCSYKPDSGHFSPVRNNFVVAFFSGINIKQILSWHGLAL